MSERERLEIPGRPVTTRVGGGLPPRVVALGVAGVLLAVVWIGTTGNSTPSLPSPAVPMPSPVAQGQSSTPPITPAAEPSLAAPTPQGPATTPRPRALLANRYVAIGAVGGERLRAELIEVSPGVLTGQYWLSDRPSGDELAFEIVEVEKVGPWTYMQAGSIGAWNLSLEELAGNHRSGHEPLTVTVAARPGLLGAPPLIERGYELGVYVRLTFDDVAVVDFHVEVGPAERPKSEDGVPGWPISGALA